MCYQCEMSVMFTVFTNFMKGRLKADYAAKGDCRLHTRKKTM